MKKNRKLRRADSPFNFILTFGTLLLGILFVWIMCVWDSRNAAFSSLIAKRGREFDEKETDCGSGAWKSQLFIEN